MRIIQFRRPLYGCVLVGPTDKTRQRESPAKLAVSIEDAITLARVYSSNEHLFIPLCPQLTLTRASAPGALDDLGNNRGATRVPRGRRLSRDCVAGVALVLAGSVYGSIGVIAIFARKYGMGRDKIDVKWYQPTCTLKAHYQCIYLVRARSYQFQSIIL